MKRRVPKQHKKRYFLYYDRQNPISAKMSAVTKQKSLPYGWSLILSLVFSFFPDEPLIFRKSVISIWPGTENHTELIANFCQYSSSKDTAQKYFGTFALLTIIYIWFIILFIFFPYLFYSMYFNLSATDSLTYPTSTSQLASSLPYTRRFIYLSYLRAI